jgi:cobalt-precorrin-5B (C1)-methyltransferase
MGSAIDPPLVFASAEDYINAMSGRKPEGTLRKGWTTGACAAAGALAAFQALTEGAFPASVSIRLPGGETPAFPLSRSEKGESWAEAGIIKDAGDDPDVTHGAEIVTRVQFGAKGQGLRYHAGAGVGKVTLPGLPLPVGEAAINPGPRAIIAANLKAAAGTDTEPDLDITISIPGGEEIALKTMNGRLGIKGGLSVLGTTGIVVPYSCASWIHSIHRGVDVARATGIDHIASATGSTSEAAVRDMLGLSDQALIDMGDFAGGLLKYLRSHPIPKLTLAGGFGKLSKLAQGHMDLHSSRSEIDMTDLAATAERAGADTQTARDIAKANTAMQALELAAGAGVPLADAMAGRARGAAMAALAGDTAVDVLIFDRAGRLVGRADGSGP